MILALWLQRLLGRLCKACGGVGEVNPSQLERVDPIPCSSCLGTGMRIVERAELAAAKHGHPRERRK